MLTRIDRLGRSEGGNREKEEGGADPSSLYVWKGKFSNQEVELSSMSTETPGFDLYGERGA